MSKSAVLAGAPCWRETLACRSKPNRNLNRVARCAPSRRFSASGGRMLRFAAAVLAVAAIAPTPAEKGLARLSEALASPAIVNNDVLWTRCGALDKIAPNPTTVVAAKTRIAAGPSQSRCNDSHLAVGALGVMNGVEDGPTSLHARSRSSILLCCLRLIPSRTSLPAPPTTPSPAVPMLHAGCNGSHLAVGALGVMNGVEDRE